MCLTLLLLCSSGSGSPAVNRATQGFPVSSSRSSVLAGLWLIFFINGAVLSSWAPRIPLVKERLGLLDSEFGIALLGIALGAVPAMLVTARILRRVRDTALCAITTIAFPAALPAISITTGLESLTTVLIILGAASGGLDVAMNALATRLQALWRFPVLGRLHGAYSLGVLCGTASAVVATRLNLSIGTHFTAVSTILLIAAIAALTVLLPRAPHASAPAMSAVDDADPAPRGRTVSHRLPISIGVIAIGGFLLEGLITDWSALLLRRDLNADPTIAASVLSLFSIAMFLSRSLSDAVLRRTGARKIVLIAAVVIATSTPLAIAIASVPLVVVSLTITGLCVGPMFPLALAQAGQNVPNDLAGVSARLSIIGYAAYIAGLPAIGFAAENSTLPLTFTVVLLATATLLIIASLSGHSGSSATATRPAASAGRSQQPLTGRRRPAPPPWRCRTQARTVRRRAGTG